MRCDRRATIVLSPDGALTTFFRTPRVGRGEGALHGSRDGFRTPFLWYVRSANGKFEAIPVTVQTLH